MNEQTTPAVAEAKSAVPPAQSSKKRITWLSRGYRSVSEAGTIQILAALLVVFFAVFIARFSWTLPDGETPTPLTNAAERALYDLRSYYSADMVEPDERVVLVVFTDQTLIKAQKRSPLPRDMLAEALANLDGMGA